MATQVCGRPEAGHDCWNRASGKVAPRQSGSKLQVFLLRPLYSDHQGNVVPIPVLRSYSEGLTPAEYRAGSFGARQGVIGVKLGTAKAGTWASSSSRAPTA